MIRLGRHAGQSAAIVAGVRAARRAWIATLDGDGQDNPADLPRMLPMICARTAPALVVGHRLRRRDVLAKRVASGEKRPLAKAKRAEPAAAAPAPGRASGRRPLRRR